MLHDIFGNTDILKAWISKRSIKIQNKVGYIYMGPEYGIYKQFNCFYLAISVFNRACAFVTQGFYFIGFHKSDSGFCIVYSKIEEYFLNIPMLTQRLNLLLMIAINRHFKLTMQFFFNILNFG